MHKLLHGSMEECGDVWQYLSGLRRPIVLYGMGDGADKILRVCKRYDIRIADFFASDDFVRGQCFHDRRVLTFSEILSKYDDFTVVIGFSTARKEVLERLYFLDSRFDVVVPDVPLYGDEVFTLEYLKEHTEEFTRAYELLADEQSRLVYRSVLFSKLTGRLFFMQQAASENSDIQDLLRLRDVRFYADLGAYRGDTVQQMQRCAPDLSRVWAFEPDEKNYKKLEEFAARQKIEIHTYPLAAWSGSAELYFEASGNRNAHAVGEESCTGGRRRRITRIKAGSLDDILQGERVDFIKYDVEGAEKEAILGSERTLSLWRPRLLVSVYHRVCDLFALPLLIHRICPTYRLMLRKSMCVPAWEVCLLCENEAKTP